MRSDSPLFTQEAISVARRPDIRTRELTISRLLPAPRSQVFKMWAAPGALARWWGPFGITTPICEMDLRPGGVFRTVMRGPDGKEYPAKALFIETAEPQRIVFTDAFEPGFYPAAESFVTTVITFEEFRGKTKHTTRALHKTATDCQRHELMGFYQGWNECLDRLAACLSQP